MAVDGRGLLIVGVFTCAMVRCRPAVYQAAGGGRKGLLLPSGPCWGAQEKGYNRRRRSCATMIYMRGQWYPFQTPRGRFEQIVSSQVYPGHAHPAPNAQTAPAAATTKLSNGGPASGARHRPHTPPPASTRNNKIQEGEGAAKRRAPSGGGSFVWRRPAAAAA